MGGLLRLALELFVFYILYKLIVDFIIPIYKTTKNMSGKMQDMKRRMDEQQRTPQQTTPKAPEAPRPPKEDYIEYEEVK